ncbi:MAG: AMP nucleosidase, partial [Roseovarius sp.]
MNIHTPDRIAPEAFTEARAAVDRLCQLYAASTDFLCEAFARALAGDLPQGRVRAFYPEIRLTTATYAKVDSRLSFGHVSNPGIYAATITRPDLFRAYLEQQIGLLLVNHGVGITIGHSDTPIPVHFAVAADAALSVPQERAAEFTLRDYFDVPDLATTNDDIVNGTWIPGLNGAAPLAPFTAQRVDYSLARLTHYTATDPCHFQNYVLFTNYQFYVSEFETYAR